MTVSASNLEPVNYDNPLTYDDLFPANVEQRASVGHETYRGRLFHIWSQHPSLEPAPEDFVAFLGATASGNPLGFVPLSSVVLHQNNQFWLHVQGVQKDGARFAIWSKDKDAYSRPIFVDEGRIRVIPIPKVDADPRTHQIFFLPS
ncbi:hypothetical protein PCANC_05133 [Puccinia coronata f. sp. avenae]|uniref:Uncharacterized protein n=1 Tax=Puccinia coronata f. sp. avenae TaxID=200324 RepID=A0A2N5W324_9BASI|nr:hypothetical protein PCANC_05133 [Puccinia coronata f. sp. avenae]